MALEADIQRIVLRDARAVLGGASPQAQRQCVESMQRLIDELMRRGIVAKAEPQALAALIYGSLEEATLWIAASDDGKTRLAQSIAALELLLRGLLLNS